jgi:hypothetical protein
VVLADLLDVDVGALRLAFLVGAVGLERISEEETVDFF